MQNFILKTKEALGDFIFEVCPRPFRSGVSVKPDSVRKHRDRKYPDAVPHIGNQFVLHSAGAFQGSNSWTFSGWLRFISAAVDISQDK